MSGPEHYREAERLLAAVPDAMRLAEDRKANGETLAAALANLIAQAQAHATLAVAAASVADRGIGPQESSGWRALHPEPAWQEATS